MEALLYEKLNHKNVRCHVCEHHCLIKEGKRGLCGVRENMKGELIALNYPYTIAASIDNIEKKPLRQYLPQTKTYSFATEGCNFSCPWCQNHPIALDNKTGILRGTKIPPSQHVERALRYQCPSISYTYTEPTIFLEYALETMKLANKKGLKNIWVTNGYMTMDTLSLILPYLDAVNIDLKVASEEDYRTYTGGSKEIVLRNIEYLKRAKVHVEVTCLLVPEINTKEDQIEQMLEDLHDILGNKQPLHLSRFYGAYKLSDVHPTSREVLYQAEHMAKDMGFEYVYLGNM